MGSAHAQRSKSDPPRKSTDDPRKGTAAPTRNPTGMAQPAFVSRHPSISVPVQRKVALGQPGDAYEKEAESAAEKVSSGGSVGPESISSFAAGGMAQSASRKTADEAKPAKPVQKVDASPDKSKKKAAADSGAKPAQKASDKRPDQSADKSKAAPAQRRLDKPGEKKDATQVLQQAPEKRNGAEKTTDPKPAQKAEASNKSEKMGSAGKGGGADQDSKAQKADQSPKPEPEGKRAAPVQKAEGVKEGRPGSSTGAKSGKDAPNGKGAVQKAGSEAKPERHPKQPAQRAIESENANKDQKTVQKEAGSGAGAPATNVPAAAESAIMNPGAGTPLQAGTRSALEAGFGSDFSGVRVHDDDRARDTAGSLDARAFTHGNDIWLGHGESQNDLNLMAHEATHVLQQGGTARRAVVQRNGGSSSPSSSTGSSASPATADAGTVDASAKKITIPTLAVPSYARKADRIPAPLTLPRSPVRPNDQRQVWSRGIAADGAYQSSVQAKLQNAPGVDSARTGKKVHFLEPANRPNFIIAGDVDALADKLALPTWNTNGGYHSFDVDHILEMQLGGTNDLPNMELLDSSANRSSGSLIRAEVVKKIAAAVAPEVGPGKTWSRAPDPRQVQQEYEITFTNKDPSLTVAGNSDIFWSAADVKAGVHLQPLRVLPVAEIEQRGLRGDPTQLKVFRSERGGRAETIPWEPNITEKSYAQVGFLKNFNLASVSYTPGSGGSLTGTKYPNHKVFSPKPVTLALTEIGGLDYTTAISRGGAASALGALNAKGASPLELGEPYLDPDGGLMATGVLRTTLPFLGPLEIDISISSDELTLSKTFTAGEFALPGPVRVTESTLTLSGGTNGLSLEGDARFEVKRLGRGHLGARISSLSDTGLELTGGFDFDSELFDRAAIEVWFRNNAFGGAGTIAITSPNKVKGIRSASIQITIDQGRFRAAGTVSPTIPGVQEAGLTVDYSEENGLTIGGSLQLANVPGISSGSINVTLQQKGDGGWKLAGTGTATPNIPGVATQLNIAYDDGLFDINGTANYARGMLSGSLAVGVTNRPVAEGQPSGEPGRTLTLYGGGTLSVQLAPWLKGTVGIRLLPNGELEVTGEIALPSTLDLFPEKKLEKELFHIGLDIPIVGVAVAGQRIGIFANITGGLTLSAGVGPGQLQDVRVGIKYNPSHEDQTEITGGAKLHVPAHAGLRLFVRGGLGVGIPIVSAQAGLEIGGQLGLEGALDSSVDVNWTPARGLVLDASTEIFVEPVFRFDITGFVLVEADLLLTTIELYSKRWQLAGFEWGSGLRFGVRLPVHYEEEKGFDLSFDNLQFTVPDIDPTSLLSDLIGRIA